TTPTTRCPPTTTTSPWATACRAERPRRRPLPRSGALQEAERRDHLDEARSELGHLVGRCRHDELEEVGRLAASLARGEEQRVQLGQLSARLRRVELHTAQVHDVVAE